MKKSNLIIIITKALTYLGTEIFDPKKIAFKNSLFVPYQVPLKFGLSAKSTTLPEPKPETIK